MDDDLIDVPSGTGSSTARGLVAAADAFVEWLRPKGRRSRHVTVPVLSGMPIGKARIVAMRAGVKLQIVRLVEPPAAVEGYVVAQRPPPGTVVKRHSTVTLDVFHEPR